MYSGSSSKPPSSAWKGKQKASDSDYDDLNPIITYRHLHSNNLGVKDPLRVIALCDSDAFYAACEQVRLGLDPSIPLVVQQWDSLIAVNYPARKFGISRMDKVKDAKKRCPNLVAVHVATYKEGEKEPGYWDNPDTLTHKVGSLLSCSFARHGVIWEVHRVRSHWTITDEKAQKSYSCSRTPYPVLR